MDKQGPAAYHFLEPGTPADIEQTITHAAPAVAAASRNLTNCLDMACRWSETLTRLGVEVIQLGRQGLSDRGGYLEPDAGATCDHQFLAVGHGLHLFDPTAGQFAQPVEVGRYFVYDGRSFLCWRAGQLATERNPAG